MSLAAMTWAFSLRVPPQLKIVLLSLADYADEDGYCYPSQETLAAKSSMGVRTVQRHLSTLETMGYLSTEERRRPDGYRSSNGYHLSLKSPATLAGEPTSPAKSDDLTRQSEQPHPPTVAEQEPSVEPSVEKDMVDVFDLFWDAWPRKVKKPEALRAWAKAKKKIPQADLVTAALRYRDNPGRPDTQFIPHPATWLNNECWNDALPAHIPRGNQPAARPAVASRQAWAY